MRNILHITPHFGGGVGRVLLNYLKKVQVNSDFKHKVLCLEYANEKARLASQAIPFPLTDKISSNPEGMLAEIAEADVVLIHWWNHPLLFTFLVREILPPARIIFWSHISGFHAPYVFSNPVLNYPDLFVFTTPISHEVPELNKLPEERQRVLRTIWSTGGIEHVSCLQPKLHKGFKVGYIGTVDYCKMHPGFLRMSNNIKIEDAQFIVCGGPREKQIQEESLQYDSGERFVFTGQVDDITVYLSEFDVFGYPLAPYHYGTCEQSLSESMAAGVPPVVLANRTESYMVEDRVTGIVAADEEAYSQSIEELYRKPELRRRLSSNAREAAKRRFSIDRMVKKWERVFNEALALPKTVRQWTGKYHGKSTSPSRVFLESLGEYGEIFLNSMRAENKGDEEAAKERIRRLYQSSHLWRSNTRGTPSHYHCFFPEDRYLKLWSHQMRAE